MTLHVESAGSGPLLLLVHGGNGDCDVFAGLTSALTDRFRVVTWVRRGFVRSPLDGPVPEDRVAADVDDALALIGDGRAHVFGSSSGAIVALELLARRPDRVGTIVAHEPPLLACLPDGQVWRARHAALHERFRREGVRPAFAAFVEAIGITARMPPPDMELPPAVVAMIERAEPNQAVWFEHELRQYPDHALDLDALRVAGDRLVIGIGRDSGDQMPGRCAQALAVELGRAPVPFPGGHAGYGPEPAAFAEVLAGILADPGPT